MTKYNSLITTIVITFITYFSTKPVAELFVTEPSKLVLISTFLVLFYVVTKTVELHSRVLVASCLKATDYEIRVALSTQDIEISEKNAAALDVVFKTFDKCRAATNIKLDESWDLNTTKQRIQLARLESGLDDY